MATGACTERLRASARWKIGFGLALAALALVAAPPTVHAGVITVQAYTDGVANPANCPGANCRLRDAIAAANSGDMITFSSAGHTIPLTQGQFNLNKDVTISWSGAVGDITIDAQSGSRVFNIATGTTATLDTLFIQNGAAAAGNNGGAIRVASGATLNLNNVSVENSQVTGSGDLGGAIYNGGTLNITNFAFFMNNQTAAGGNGGALYNDGVATLSGTVYSGGNRSIYFFGNGAAGEGGTIYNNGTLTATNIQVNNSAARDGGAIANEQMLTVQQSLIVGSQATGSGTHGLGGGIRNAITGTLNIIDSSVAANTANRAGGGIYNLGTVRVDRSLLYNNAVNAAGIFGGGVANEGTTIMENSTVSNNSAVTDGGGIFNGIGSDTELFNVTITQNTADSDSDGMGEGGGVYDGCPSGFLCVVLPYTLTLQNSIISGNFDTPNNGGPGPIHPDCHGPLKSLAYNLIHTVAGCTINGDTTGNILGQPADLAPLAENGGWTPTHALLPASPAIDAGNPLVPGSSRPACAKTDQRGYPRGGAAGRCDIGAFERVFLLSLPLIRR